jgi:hypothetical protein
MPAAYHIDQQHHLVRSSAWGILTDCESLDHYQVMVADPAFDPSLRQLCDMRQVTQIAMTTGALRKLAESSVFVRGTKRAFVAPADAHFGLARILQTFCEFEGTEIGVFRSIAEAEEWLGLAPGSVDQHE